MVEIITQKEAALIMDLNKLRKPDLVLMCEELGIELGKTVRKPHIIEAI